MRDAKNEDGKTYYVLADMTYRDWEKKLVVQKPKGLLKRNKKNDRREWENAKSLDKG